MDRKASVTRTCYCYYVNWIRHTYTSYAQYAWQCGCSQLHILSFSCLVTKGHSFPGCIHNNQLRMECILLGGVRNSECQYICNMTSTLLNNTHVRTPSFNLTPYTKIIVDMFQVSFTKHKGWLREMMLRGHKGWLREMMLRGHKGWLREMMLRGHKGWLREMMLRGHKGWLREMMLRGHTKTVLGG